MMTFGAAAFTVYSQQRTRLESIPARSCRCFVQVMMYRSLLLGLADACDAECGAEILALHRLDGKAQLSKEVSHL